jgi:hypothetical protein
MAGSFYVSSPGKIVMLFAGPHGLKHALNFAALARMSGVDGVLVGWTRQVAAR